MSSSFLSDLLALADIGGVDFLAEIHPAGRLKSYISKERIAQREARRAAGQRTDATERLRDLADALTNRAAALRRLADAEKPLYESLDEAQKRRFGIALRFAVRRHRAEAHTHG
jgi:hypothetical protein